MDYEIKKKRNDNFNNYQKDELDIAIAYAKVAYKEFHEFLKGIILFGSAARELGKKNSKDIDILMVLDDIGIELNKEVAETYHIISTKLVAEISPRIHITTIKLSTFWDYVRKGDPIGMNILRDGVSLIDTGFFDPLQALLQRGQIKPTFESIYAYFNRATETLKNSRKRNLDATIDLYWAVVDSAHAALMKAGKIPTTPDKVANMIKENLVKKKYCSNKHAETMNLFYGLYKEITHNQIQDITGQEFERYYAKAKDFVGQMKQIINNI